MNIKSSCEVNEILNCLQQENEEGFRQLWEKAKHKSWIERCWEMVFEKKITNQNILTLMQSHQSKNISRQLVVVVQKNDFEFFNHIIHFTNDLSHETVTALSCHLVRKAIPIHERASLFMHPHLDEGLSSWFQLSEDQSNMVEQSLNLLLLKNPLPSSLANQSQLLSSRNTGMFDYKEALLHAPDRILNIVLTYIPLSPHQSSSIFKRSKHLSGETWNKMINQVPLKDIVQAHQTEYSPALGLGSLGPSTSSYRLSILLNPEIAKAKAEGEALMLKKQIQCDLDLAEEKTIKGSTKKM